jgi:hypothetical protein
MFQVGERERYENGKWLEMLSTKAKGMQKYNCDTRFLDLLNKIQVTIVSHSFNNVIPKNVVIWSNQHFFTKF